jgi:hypothetical protein
MRAVAGPPRGPPATAAGVDRALRPNPVLANFRVPRIKDAESRLQPMAWPILVPDCLWRLI